MISLNPVLKINSNGQNKERPGKNNKNNKWSKENKDFKNESLSSEEYDNVNRSFWSSKVEGYFTRGKEYC